MVNRRKRGSAGKFFAFTETLKKKGCKSVGVHLDTSLDSKEEKRFRKKYSNLSKQLSKQLPLTLDEVECLMIIYYKFQKAAGGHSQPGMTKLQLKDILQAAFDITSADMIESVAYILDKSPSPYMAIENWVRGMALFLRGTFEEKVWHCFNVYDMYADGCINKDRMVNLMSGSVIGEEDTEDVVKDLVDIIIKKLDVDRDGKITYEDFKQCIKQQPLLMECLGQCLPTRLAATAFLISFTPYIGKL
ncbi:hypothetical protein ILUMI_00024 [Ignelater luminosus]|uniref:EF-hand domain-containing protein n=1 Tax=Ignelater luminosus TaxID=2038154 RepID=A0A8K0GNH9_IGNLU|nr:hypothetical protein ILUMI_00024 [Ignelater luminosus]